MLPSSNTTEPSSLRKTLDIVHLVRLGTVSDNCRDIAKKIVELAATPIVLPERKDSPEPKSEVLPLRTRIEALAKEFLTNYFTMKIPAKSAPLVSRKPIEKSPGCENLSAKFKQDEPIIIAMEILFQNLEKSTDQELLVDYAFMLYKNNADFMFNSILQRLESLGNVWDVLLLKILATKNTNDPKTEDLFKKLEGLIDGSLSSKILSDMQQISRVKGSSLTPAAELFEGANSFSPYPDNTKTALNFVQELIHKNGRPLLKRGFEELVVLMCDKYQAFELAEKFINKVMLFDLDEETTGRVCNLMPTILLYKYLKERKSPLLSLNGNSEVVFNFGPDKNNADLEMADNFNIYGPNGGTTYTCLLTSLLSLIKGTSDYRSYIDYHLKFRSKDLTSDPASLLLQFYHQLLNGNLKQVPPKPDFEKGCKPLFASKENILEYSFKHDYLYARALAILSLQGNSRVYLIEALDHLNTIIAEKHQTGQYLDEAYYKIRGRILFKLENFSGALEDFRFVYMVKKEDPRRVLDYATVLTKLGKHSESLNCIHSLFQTLPKEKEDSKNLHPLVKLAFVNTLACYQTKINSDELNKLRSMLLKSFSDKSARCQQHYALAQLALRQKHPLAEIFLEETLLIAPNFQPALDDYLQTLKTEVKNIESEIAVISVLPNIPKKEVSAKEKKKSPPAPTPVDPQAEARRWELVEQTRIEEEREKARFAQLRRDHQKQQKEEKRIATGRAHHLPIQTQPVNLVPPHTAPQEWLPELQVKRKFTVEYLMNEYIPHMNHCTHAELTEAESTPIQKIDTKKEKAPSSHPQPPKRLDDRKFEELTPYRKDKIEETPLISKIKKTKKKKENKSIVRDNPDINRVESARRYMRELEDLFKIHERDYPQSVPLNAYAVDRALRYYLMRFGECLHSTSEKSVLSAEVAKEISTQIMDVEIAHQLRDDVRNWFQFITSNKLNLTCQSLVKFQLHDSLKSWIENKDKTDPAPFKPTQPLLWCLKCLVPPDEKAKWKQLDKSELQNRYLTLLIQELDSLSLIRKSEKMSRTLFQAEGKTYQSAVKMSISIIAKCLTNMEMNLKDFKGLIDLSNLIGHEIGENEQIRYYEFEEIKDASILYDLSLYAEKLKFEILERLNFKA